MKTEDFEKAIDALGYKIDIDEMKLKGGQVRECYGHLGCVLLMWDGSGFAYSVAHDTKNKGKIDHDTHDAVPIGCYNRDSLFDLKF